MTVELYHTRLSVARIFASRLAKRMLDISWKGAIYLGYRVVRWDTPGISYCRWTWRETATDSRGEEHHSGCIPVALRKRGVGTEREPGTSRTPRASVRRAGIGVAGCVGTQTNPGGAAPQAVR